MAISREDKEKQVADLADKLGRSKLTVLADYKGLSVAEMEAMRADLRAQDSRFQIAKNSLIKIAAEQAGILKQVDASVFDGPSGLAFGFNDEISIAQALDKFALAHPALEIRGAINADGVWLTAEEVKVFANLPSKEQLLAQLVGTLAAPVTGFARVLAGNITGLINVLNAVQAK